MNKAERNSFGQSGEPKKLQAPAKRRELAKKMSKAIERKKGHIGADNSHFHYDKNRSHYEPEAWNKKVLRQARKEGGLTRRGEELLGKMK